MAGHVAELMRGIMYAFNNSRFAAIQCIMDGVLKEAKGDLGKKQEAIDLSQDMVAVPDVPVRRSITGRIRTSPRSIIRISFDLGTVRRKARELILPIP